MKSTRRTALLLLTAPVLALPVFAALRERPEAGDPAPEISAPTWFNHLGQSPTLAGLKGQAVLIDFWATWCAPCVEAWPHLEALHQEFGPSGLVVLGLSGEADDTVAGFVADNGYTARIAAGSMSGADWGVSSIPDTVLIDPSGEIVFRGHPSELSDALVARVVKKARKPDPKAALRYVPVDAPHASASAAAAAAEKGDLARALSLADAAAEAEPAAKPFATELTDHAELLLSQAAFIAEQRDAQRALDAYALLAKELGGTPFGKKAAEAKKALEDDEEFQQELKAALAFEKLERKVARLSSAKAADQYADFAEEYAGTRVGAIAKKRSFKGSAR